MAYKAGIKVSLEFSGDWSIDEISERVPQLNEWLIVLMAQSDAKPVPEIGLGRVGSLDVCGCQLMAAFLAFLNQQGFHPVFQTIPDNLRDKIQHFGFECAFTAA